MGLFEIKLVSPEHPLAKALKELHKKRSGLTPIRYGGAQLGGMAIDWAIIYPLGIVAAPTP